MASRYELWHEGVRFPHGDQWKRQKTLDRIDFYYLECIKVGMSPIDAKIMILDLLWDYYAELDEQGMIK